MTARLLAFSIATGSVVCVPGARAPAAGLAVRRLDLDHVGAGLGHQQRGVRALEDLTEIQHSDASQRGVHARRSTEPRTATMRRLRLMRKADSIDAIDLRLETCDPPPRGPDELLIELHAAGVNRSDVAAALGRMPHAAWPRTPGRDWAGVVLEGPTELAGQEVFGAGGDLGITRDGTHATHLVVPRDAAVAKPATLTLAEAGALGVPFVTAQQGFQRAGMPRPGDVVLVLAVNGRWARPRRRSRRCTARACSA